jgi:hypothetical protein
LRRPPSCSLSKKSAVIGGLRRRCRMAGGHLGGHRPSFTEHRGGPPTDGRAVELQGRTPTNERGPHADKLLIRGFGVRVPDGPPYMSCWQRCGDSDASTRPSSAPPRRRPQPADLSILRRVVRPRRERAISGSAPGDSHDLADEWLSALTMRAQSRVEGSGPDADSPGAATSKAAVTAEWIAGNPWERSDLAPSTTGSELAARVIPALAGRLLRDIQEATGFFDRRVLAESDRVTSDRIRDN